MNRDERRKLLEAALLGGQDDMVTPSTSAQLSAARRERDIAERKLALEQSRTGVLREALNLALNAPECHKDADNYDPFDPECACAGCRARGQALLSMKSRTKKPKNLTLFEVPASDRRTSEPSTKGTGELIVGDCLRVLKATPDATFQSCVTSPPYWGLRDYGVEGQIGAEVTVDAYIAQLTAVFREVRRTLSDNGTLWLNIGDSYTSGGRTWRDGDKKNPARAMSYRAPTPEGLKPKDLIGIPWKLAFALQADGWYLRSDIVWYKPNAQPESVKDRPTRSHEYVFLFSKAEHYFYDHEAVKEEALSVEGKRARRTVWSVPTEPFRDAHFATFPPKLVEPCILASTRPGELVLDPFFGAGTVGLVASALGRNYLGIELKDEYAEIARRRLSSSGARQPRSQVA